MLIVFRSSHDFWVSMFGQLSLSNYIFNHLKFFINNFHIFITTHNFYYSNLFVVNLFNFKIYINVNTILSIMTFSKKGDR